LELRASSKQPPDKSGGIVGFRLRLPDFVGYFHPPALLVVLESEEQKSAIFLLTHAGTIWYKELW
jgi:hypothetical protein